MDLIKTYSEPSPLDPDKGVALISASALIKGMIVDLADMPKRAYFYLVEDSSMGLFQLLGRDEGYPENVLVKNLKLPVINVSRVATYRWQNSDGTSKIKYGIQCVFLGFL